MNLQLLDLRAVDPSWVVVVAAALVLVQTALVVGFLLPGGKAAVLAGVVAGLGDVPVLVAWLGVVVAAVVGAGLGFEIGRRHGDRVLEHRWLRRHQVRLGRAQELMRRRAAVGVVLGRSVAVLRATTPTLAGAVGVGRGRFLLWNVVGAVLWGTLFVGLGYVGGSSVPDLAGSLTTGNVQVVAAALTLAVLGLLTARRLRAGGRAGVEVSQSAQESAHSE